MLPLSYKKQYTGQGEGQPLQSLKEKSFQKPQMMAERCGNQREQNNSGQICRNTYNFWHKM